MGSLIQKIFQHENLSYESFGTQKFPDLWYMGVWLLWPAWQTVCLLYFCHHIYKELVRKGLCIWIFPQVATSKSSKTADIVFIPIGNYYTCTIILLKVIFGGANLHEKSDKAPRINFCGFKFRDCNSVYKCAVLCQ